MIVKAENEEHPEFKTDEILVSENTFNPAIPIETVLAFLRETHSTGELIFNLANGGVNRARFVQKQAIEVVTK